MDVGGWLRGLGLGQYEEQFRNNKIDADLLPRLTVDDLKDIGVSVVGDRRRLLDAIAVVAGAGPAASPTKSAPSKGLQASAERRPITVMFCDLVGSTSLAARLDAEDWRNLVNAYLDEASAAVIDLDGHVLKKLGDGLMALFGYPHAQENDAERAVRAALAIQRALADLNARNTRSGGPELSARIGIEYGSVVVDAGGEVFGEAPNVAARVQAAAEPGSVLITGSVQRQTAGLFVVEEKGAHELKGVAQPLSLYRVVRASGGGRRGGVRALTQFVGREEDIGTLLRRWDRVRAGEGQFVQIVGEPGLGKSRLVEEFHSRLGETPHTWVEWNSSQLLQNTPLHPVAEWGRARFGGHDVAAERRLADLETTLAQVKLDVQETATLLAPLLDIPLPAERATKFGPEELRRRQLATMVALLLAGARTQPVVLAFEDLHWADPTSLDLIQALAERGAQAPLLVVATTRPEFRAPWGMRSHHAVVALAPLDRTEVRRMVGEIAAQHTLPQDVVESVNERTGGVPLFVEEVTRLLVERGEQGGVQAIPPTLQQSLAARLDRLGSAREIAQIGAVLGRDFAYSLLRNIAETAEPALQASLERLADSDLLFVEGAPPEATYRFKHALIQDAAYDSLLKSRRQALHRRAAEVLRDSAEGAAAEPEVVAHHFTQAGLDELAIEWWGKAGDQALRRSAFQEAIAHLGKAIEMADRAGATARSAPGGSAAPNQRLTQLHVAHANALWAARGVGAPETTEAFARARESAYGDKDAPERLPSHFGLWASSYIRGELPEMRAHAAAFLRDVEASPASPEASVAHRTAGITCWFVGDYREARDHLERALALFRPGRDDDLAFRFGQDPGVVAMANLAAASWPLGEVDRAISLIDRMKTRVAGLTHVSTLASSKLYTAMFELMRGDHLRATPNALELVRLTGEQELPMFRAFGVFLKGWASAASGASGSGLEDMRRGVEQLREQNVLFFDGLLKIALAEGEARAGDPDRAVAILDEALATADRLGYRAFEAELHRARGDALLKRGPAIPAPAEEAFLTAIAVAKQQGTRSFGLRSALSLAKLYQSTGRLADAHGVLSPALEGFAPTPEMPEIAEAGALLAMLAETEPVREALEKRQARAKMHVDYARAVQWAKGWGSEEARAAVERAHEFTAPTPGHPDYWSLTYGRFAVALLRGEFHAALEIAETYLRQAQVEGRPDHAVNARRLLGTVKLELGAFPESRQEFEKLLEDWEEDRDKGLQAVTGADVLCVGWAYMAQLLVILGEVDDAVRMSKGAIRRAESLSDFGSLAFASGLSLFVLAMCGLNEATLCRAEAFEAKALEKGARLWESIAREWASWARGRITGDAAGAATELRDILAARLDRQDRQSAYMGKGVLAQLQGKAGAIDAALASIAEGLEVAEQTGGHRADSFLHRVRGDVLAERDPAVAEAAYREAVRIAQNQGARTFELQAAHALAKLYQSTGHPVEAHAVLAPALEGFAPTPEMPEIAEAQALFAALAETEDVKSTEAQRQRRLHLQTAYSQAMMWSKGFAAEETQAAFARAGELAERTDSFLERFAALQGQWAASCTRGELRSVQEPALAFLREAEDAGRVEEAGITNFWLGLVAYWHGDFVEARTRYERGFAARGPNPDPKVRDGFGDDRTWASAIFAVIMWQLGEIEGARELISCAIQRASEIGHIGGIADVLFWKSYLEIWRGDPLATLSAAEALESAAREYGVVQYLNEAELHYGWARGRIKEPMGGAAEIRRVLAAFVDQGVRVNLGFYTGLLAQLEAETLGAESALARVDEAFRLSNQVEHRCSLPFLHRLRGEILLKLDPADPAPAEADYRVAIAIAKEQGARSPVLLASLSLAKLYQLTGRPIDAHAVLAPALEGFSPTPEMPEIAEAMALLVAIQAGAEARHE